MSAICLYSRLSSFRTHLFQQRAAIATTTCLNSRIIKKRITRIPNDYQVYQDEVDEGKQSSNDSPPLELMNRNPRNLEQLNREPKPLGWEMETPTKTFWNKIVFQKSAKFLTAHVVHHTGRVIISASTGDAAFQSQCSGMALTDSTAARNLAIVIARKCLESGILYLHKELPEEKTSPKVQIFVQTLAEEGVKLHEPDFIFPRRNRDL